jgi:hypothetical protein
MLSYDHQRQGRKFYGKYSGEVVDNSDDRTSGRITVTVPSIFGPEMNVVARPCFPTAHFFVPPVGAKVWVEFEAGDPSYPIWVGIWYATDQIPPEAAVSPPDNRVIQTPSGHTIEIDDTQDDERIVIRHKINSFISIDKDGNVLLSNQEGSHLHLNAADGNATFMEQHGNLLTMNDQGATLVNKDGTTLEMKGGNIRVIGSGSVQIAANDVSINAAGIGLGEQAMEPAVLGQTFSSMWNQFILHTHPTAVGPTGPGIPPGLPLAPGTGLSMNVKVK